MRPYRVTLHCSASENGKAYPIDQIRKDHMEQNGWDDVGYHFVIQPDGKSEIGRPVNQIGAGVAGANLGNIHICMVGEDRFTEDQFRALRPLLDFLVSCYDIERTQIFGHYEFESAGGTLPVAPNSQPRQKKTCPNIRITDLVLWFLHGDWKAVQPYLLMYPWEKAP